MSSVLLQILIKVEVYFQSVGRKAEDQEEGLESDVILREKIYSFSLLYRLKFSRNLTSTEIRLSYLSL